MNYKMNAREELEAAVRWLGYHDEDLNLGLKCAEDGLKLWRYWLAHPELPEFCDYNSGETHAEAKERMRHVKKAIGYCPWDRAAKMCESDLM